MTKMFDSMPREELDGYACDSGSFELDDDPERGRWWADNVVKARGGADPSPS